MKNVNLSHSTCAAMDSLCVFARMLSAEIPAKLGEEVKYLSERNKRFFVFFLRGEVLVKPMPDEPRLFRMFANMVNAHRHRGVVYYYNHKHFTEVTCENWNMVYDTIIQRKRIVSDKVYVEKRPSYEKIFEDAKHVNRYHKPNKRGFEKTWITNYRYEKKAVHIVTP